MASSKNMDVMESRKNLPHVWRSDLMQTPLESPLYCLYTVVCPNCAAYQLRGRALRGDWSRFTCCGGSMPCSGSCGESDCPRFCAAVEAGLFFQCSVATTRFMLQDELRIQNTKCDNCIIATMIWLQYLNCICSIVACFTDSQIIDEAAVLTDRIADIAYCRGRPLQPYVVFLTRLQLKEKQFFSIYFIMYYNVCACMQTQHKNQMDERDGLVPPQPGKTIRFAPPAQEMSQY